MDRPPPSDTFEKLPRGRSRPLPPPSAVASAPIETPASLARRNATFWALAFTFVWALALEVFVFKHLSIQLNAWVELFRYQALCWIAAALLLRRRRSLRVTFAVINFAAGLAWTAAVYWAMNEFARHF